MGLVAGEPGEDVAVVPGPQRRGGGGSVAVGGPETWEGQGRLNVGKETTYEQVSLKNDIT